MRPDGNHDEDLPVRGTFIRVTAGAVPARLRVSPEGLTKDF